MRVSRKVKQKNVALEFARSRWRGKEGLQLAKTLDHPEMQWLVSLFPLELLDTFWNMVPENEAEMVLKKWCEAHPDDARALAYLAYVSENGKELFEKAAAMGDAWAMAHLAWSCSAKENFQWASKAAEQEQPMGIFLLARFFYEGQSCQKDERKANELMKMAANLGSMSAACELAKMARTSHEKVKLLSNFAVLDKECAAVFFRELRETIATYQHSGVGGDALFEAGEVLKGEIDLQNKVAFGYACNEFDSCMFAVGIFDTWCSTARDACFMWILCAKRLGIPRDVRTIIAKDIWESRILCVTY